MDIIDLKTYLSKIMNAEARKYEIDRIISQLEKQKQNCISRINQSTYLEKEKLEFTSANVIGALLLSLFFGIGGAIVGIVVRIIIDFLSWSTPYTFPELILSGALWGFCIVFIWNMISNLSDDRLEISKYNASIQKENEQIRELNLKIANDSQLAKKQLQILDSELLKLKKMGSECSSIIKKLYAFNIVYDKYHGLIPISSFYEYICSGRCYQLEGHEGAYNIYENELLAKMIIDKLDIVINQLESIKKSQYMLYTALQNSNENALHLTNLMNTAIDKLDDIDSSQQIIAYNTQLNNANTETIEWIKQFINIR